MDIKVNRLIYVVLLIVAAGLLIAARMPYEQNSRSPLIPNPGRTSFKYPDYVKHCQQRDVDVWLQNIYGSDTVRYTVTTVEDPSANSNWLAVDGWSGEILPAEIDTGIISLNVGGQICATGTIVLETGRVIFADTVHADTAVFEIELYVTDTVIAPSWDTIATTSCNVSLTVGSNGNMGHLGVGGANLDYSNTAQDWEPEYASVYLYDGGTVIGWVDGTDTVVNWGMYDNDLTNPYGLVPMGGESHSSTSWADVYTSGTYVTHDSSIGIRATFYAPTTPDTCAIIIKETKVWSLTGPKSGLMIGEVIDWDIPSDSSPSYNTSGAMSVSGYDVIYQQGIEIVGYNDSLEAANGGWDADQRFGGIVYFGGFHVDGAGDTSSVNSSPYGLYSADNQTTVFPYPYGFDPGGLYTRNAAAGMLPSDSTGDLHCGISFVFDENLGAGDTLVFFTAYATTLRNGYPAKTLDDFQLTLAKAAKFLEDHLWGLPECGCCDLAGDFNNDGSVDITDLTDQTDYFFGGGSPPVCDAEANINDDGSIDIVDLTYRVDFMFGGGPAPKCGCGPWTW